MCAGCPTSFTYIASVNGCYKAGDRNMNWPAAVQQCQSLHRNAHQLVINDSQEQLAVADMLTPKDSQFPDFLFLFFHF